MSSILKVDDIQDSGGNSIVSSNGSGTFTNNLGIANTPIFLAYHDGDRDVANGTETKVIAGTEIIDTDSAYDISTGRFTVPSGKSGYYKFDVVFTHRNTSNDQTGSGFAFYKNGSKNPFQYSNSVTIIFTAII